MPRNARRDLSGRTLAVDVPANPRVPWTHGWVAFEVLRRAPGQTLTFEEYTRRLLNPSAEIVELAARVTGATNAFQDLKHIRCDIYRRAVRVTPPLNESWFDVHRCSEGRRSKR
jgi:hypothetical protein